MNKDDGKYYQIKVRIGEEAVLERFKEFLNDVTLSYTCIYIPIWQSWNVFINVEGEDMKKAVESVIKLFIETESYMKVGELYERSW